MNEFLDNLLIWQIRFKQFSKIADQIVRLGKICIMNPDAELKAMTPEFKERLKNGQTLDDILVDAFAVVGEASTRIGETL